MESRAVWGVGEPTWLAHALEGIPALPAVSVLKIHLPELLAPACKLGTVLLTLWASGWTAPFSLSVARRSYDKEKASVLSLYHRTS